MSNLTSVGEIPLSELNPEYFKLLTKESKELVKFLKPYYSKMQLQQHPIPTLLLNWFKDTSVNYQNLMHNMNITKYTITKVEEKAIRQGEKDKGYQERFQEEYENDNKKVKIMGFTNFETFDGASGKKNPQFQLPPEFQKILEKEGIKKAHVSTLRDSKKRRSGSKRKSSHSGGAPHSRRGSRVRSMFRDYGKAEKYDAKIQFLNDSKPYLIKGLIILYDQYQNDPRGNTPLEKILDDYYRTSGERENVLKFLSDAKNDKLKVLDMSDWLNRYGKYLVRYFGHLFTEKKLSLPYELEKRMNYNPSMYNEFFPLVIQDYVEKRLNKRYEFTVEIPSGHKETDKLKLDLEVLSKSYFEPIEFPVFFNVKANVNDPDYEKFVEKNQRRTGQKHHKNISFMLARFLLVQNLHLPWIQTKNISAKVMMTPFKKQLPFSDKKSRLLAGSEINSGSRYINDINIWRREELNKLIIHETIHQAEVDFTNDIGLDGFIREHMAIDIDSEIRLYEAYTESCGLIINMFASIYEMFLVHHKWDKYAKQLQGHDENRQENNDDYERPPRKVSYRSESSRRSTKRKSSEKRGTIKRKSSSRDKRSGSNRNSTKKKSGKKKSLRSLLNEKTRRSQKGGNMEGFSIDMDKVIGEVKKVLIVFMRLEQIFSAFQTAKILHYYGFENMNEFFRPKATTKRIVQGTSVLSYFVIKGGFMNAIAKFVDFVNKMNPSESEIPPMNFRFKPQFKHEFRSLIQDCVINNIAYHKSVDMFIREIKDKKLYPRGKTGITEFNINKTLRMTLIEMADEIYD